MSEAIAFRDRMEWNRVSALMALLCNINRDPKKGKAVTPEDFNPYTSDATRKKKKSENVIEVNDAESRALFKAVVTGQAVITDAGIVRCNDGK